MRTPLTLLIIIILSLSLLTVSIVKAARHAPTFDHQLKSKSNNNNKNITHQDYYDDNGLPIVFFDGDDDDGDFEEDGVENINDDQGVAVRTVRRRDRGGSGSSCDSFSSRPHRKMTRKKKLHKDIAKAKESDSSKGELLSSNVLATWYASHDLLNPACGTGNWNPTSNAHIGAISSEWNDGPSCGQFIHLCNEHTSPHKCITIRRIDDCEGCSRNHVDLSLAAFTQLSPDGGRDIGVLKNLKMYRSGKANPWNLRLFGPFNLGEW